MMQRLEPWSAAMTRPCPGPLPPTRPKLALPPGACDTHVHVLGPYEKYPLSPARTYTAPEAPVEKLAGFLDAMGCERVVIAHVTAHGTDMSVTLDAIRVLGGRARGFAILEPDISHAELQRLHDGGIRAARLTPLHGAEVTTDTLVETANRIAPLGWHLVYAPSGADQWLDLAPRLGGLACDVVIDHMAWRGYALDGGLDQPGFRALLDALATGRCWLKLAAPHRYSKTAPPYPDLATYVGAVLEARPDRMIWASDWPHVRVWDEPMPNDADLVDWILDWGLDDAARHRILVDNPAALYGF
jgi:predicted TIM-barrel fold metal-dependent hydrolase